MAQTVTLSSVGTATIILNPVAKSTTVALSASVASSLTVAQIDMTLDDPTTTPAPTIQWVLLSSAAAMVGSSVTVLQAVYTVLSPIGGVRINSTTVTASSATFTMKVLQSVTA